MRQVQKLQIELELAKKTNPGGVPIREELESYVESKIKASLDYISEFQAAQHD